MGKENNDKDPIEKPIVEEDEIDLVEVARTIWAGRKLILKVTLVFFLLGLLVAFGSKVEFEASCKLMPESQEGMKPNLGGLGSLAGLAGINLNMGSSGALTPELYPQIAQSVPFLLKILNEPIHFEKQDTTITSYIFFKEIDKPSFISLLVKYTVGLPFVIKAWLTTDDNKSTLKNNSDSEIIRLSEEDSKLLEKFQERISVSVDKKSGIITIVSEMPDALASAELAEKSVRLLTEYITDYKISKAQKNLDFVQARFEEAKIDFKKSQEQMALFNDRNKNVVTAYALTEYQRLQTEYNISFEVYKGLATQLEQAKIKVKEETPVFTVLEPV
ncbi:MAG: hypothetical protein KAK04_06370, partial [Cyclobacteriaceae bacterium]|nr:hypothetical protein [Cyclobacteriaceae bacterium]